MASSARSRGGPASLLSTRPSRGSQRRYAAPLRAQGVAADRREVGERLSGVSARGLRSSAPRETGRGPGLHRRRARAHRERAGSRRGALLRRPRSGGGEALPPRGTPCRAPGCLRPFANGPGALGRSPCPHAQGRSSRPSRRSRGPGGARTTVASRPPRAAPPAAAGLAAEALPLHHFGRSLSALA